jgi:flotillin
MADREKDVQIAETHRDRDVKLLLLMDREVSIAAAFKDESIGKAEAQRDTRVKHLKPMQLQLKVKMKLESRLHNQSNTSRA